MTENNDTYQKKGKYTFHIITKPNFFSWINHGYGSVDKFMQLKTKDKETIFLRWKWGLSDTANYELDDTRKAILHMAKDLDMDRLDEGLRFYYEMIRKFDKECLKIKTSIGIYREKIAESFEPVEIEAIDVFGGQKVDEYL